MKKLILFLILIPFFLEATLVTTEKAQIIAEKWIELNNHKSTINTVQTIDNNGEKLIYKFSLNPIGFIIISADDAVTPVLGYSFQNNFIFDGDIIDRQDFRNPLLKQYAIQIYDLEENLSTHHKWNELIQNNFRENSREVEPMTDAMWGQLAPFNNLCPTINGQGTAVHCGATALAIIMHYWKHPVQGWGENSYQWNEETLFANFEDSIYDYTLMPGIVQNPTTEEEFQLAQLSYHCGVALEVDYGIGGSYAAPNWPFLNPWAMQNNFGFLVDSIWKFRTSYSNEDWHSLMQEDLDNLRPIYYLSIESGGHFFILDGYQNENYYHINWGWYGGANGYWYLDNLTPNGVVFNENHRCLTGLEPDWQEPAVFSSEPFFTCEMSVNEIEQIDVEIENQNQCGYYFTTEIEYLQGQSGWLSVIENSPGIILREDFAEICLEFDSNGLESNVSYVAVVHLKAGDTTALSLPIYLNTNGSSSTDILTGNAIKLNNYPNPFNPSTTISFNLTAEDAENSNIEIYNLKGQKIKTFPVILSPEFLLGKGQSSIVWDGTDENNQPVSSGMYFYQLKNGKDFSKTKRMMLLK